MTPPEHTKCNYESDQHGSSRLFRTVSRRAPGGNDPRSEPRALFILWIGVDRLRRGAALAFPPSGQPSSQLSIPRSGRWGWEGHN